MHVQPTARPCERFRGFLRHTLERQHTCLAFSNRYGRRQGYREQRFRQRRSLRQDHHRQLGRAVKNISIGLRLPKRLSSVVSLLANKPLVKQMRFQLDESPSCVENYFSPFSRCRRKNIVVIVYGLALWLGRLARFCHAQRSRTADQIVAYTTGLQQSSLGHWLSEH